MFRPRIIPVLLLSNGSAVKTKQFNHPIYLGDIINTARLFAEFEADELIVLDINASKENRSFPPEIVKQLSEETAMPFAVGGGITSLVQIEELIKAGAEKVILGTAAQVNPDFIEQAANAFGSSTISVCIDVDRDRKVRYKNATLFSPFTLEENVRSMVDKGVGEIIIQSIDNDGMRTGYDLETLKLANAISSVPVVALGGANSTADFQKAYAETHGTAYAASAAFVLHKNGVLISYPEKSQIRNLFNK